MKYKVYYDKRHLRDRDRRVALDGPDATHVFVRDVEAPSLGPVFTQMQGESWSPNGEARLLIEHLGLSHTSMMIGDVAVDENGVIWQCDSSGWEQRMRIKSTHNVLGQNLSAHILCVSHEFPRDGEYVLVTLDCAIVRIKRDQEGVVVELHEPAADRSMGSLRLSEKALWSH